MPCARTAPKCGKLRKKEWKERVGRDTHSFTSHVADEPAVADLAQRMGDTRAGDMLVKCFFVHKDAVAMKAGGHFSRRGETGVLLLAAHSRARSWLIYVASKRWERNGLPSPRL